MTGSYTYINITLLHSAFYCSIEPWVLVVSLVTVILMYFIKKYLLLRRYSAPRLFHRLIFETALGGLSYVPLMFGSGSLIFALILNQSKETWIIAPCSILMSLAIINVMNPYRVFDRMGRTVFNLVKRTSMKMAKRSESLRVLRKFELQTDYYQVNELSTLIGFKNIIYGQDIPLEILKRVDAFTRDFSQFEKDFDYPSSVKS